MMLPFPVHAALAQNKLAMSLASEVELASQRRRSRLLNRS
jgi:hypothetical protein